MILDYLLPTDAAKGMAIGAAVFIALDTVTGVWAAIVKKKAFTSQRFARIGSKLIGYSAVVIVCAVATNALPAARGMQETAICGVIGFVLATEGLSILENVAKMGLPVPQRLKDILKGAKEGQGPE
jgi:toxin secretion/phage lysis holin